MTLNESAAGWVAGILLAALGALFSVMSSARTRAGDLEQEMPSAVPATRNGQRRTAQAVGRGYIGWALVATAVTVAACVPSVVVLANIDTQAPISWQRCGLVAVSVVWIVATVRTWTHARRLLKASWL